MQNWNSYFTVTAGASASLTGFIFIGLSLNLHKILKITRSHLPTRALGSILLLSNILIVSSFHLIPGQPVCYIGDEILGTTIIVWIVNTRIDIFSIKRVDRNFFVPYLKALIFTQLSLIPFFISAVMLCSGCAYGLYVLVPGISFSFIKCLIDAWYLLVEVNRSEIVFEKL